jgi:hypothetical protein
LLMIEGYWQALSVFSELWVVIYMISDTRKRRSAFKST